MAGKEFFFGPIAEMLFARVFPPNWFFFMKSFTKAATKKVEKTIFVLRKKWRENERGRDRERGRIRAAKPKVFIIFFYYDICQTWTKWYLITTQTRVKCVSWIHHRTILKSDKMSKNVKKKKKKKKQEYTKRGTLNARWKLLQLSDRFTCSCHFNELSWSLQIFICLFRANGLILWYWTSAGSVRFSVLISMIVVSLI